MASPSRATLQDVARRSGLSLATVSHVLGGARAGHFRAATRQRVLRAAAAVGYRASAAARAMRSGSTGTIAVLLSTVAHRSNLTPPLLAELERGLRKRSLSLSLCALAENEEDPTRLPAALASWACDGFLVNYNSHIPASLLDAISRHPTPAVWLNCRRDVDCMHHDELGNARLATTHLLAGGAKRLAYLDCGHDLAAGRGHFSERDRAAGYSAAMADAGRAACVLMGPEFSDMPENLAWMRALLSSPDRPDAVLCYGDRMAERLLVMALRLGLEPGTDLRVATIADQPCHDLGLSIATVVLDHGGLAAAAIDGLQRKLEDRQQSLPAVAVPGRLVPAVM